MSYDRPDLNGLRLVEEGRPDVWVVFHGRRHRIPDPQTYEGLFGDRVDLRAMAELAQISRGPDLSSGAMLIRGQARHPIYLLTAAYEGGIRRHFIPDFETFQAFGFDASKVVECPPLLVDGLPSGRDIVK